MKRLFLIIKSGTAKERLIVALIALILCILIGRKVIFSSGIVILAENLEVYSLDSLSKNYTPYWQEKFQYFDFGIADSVYLYGFFILLGKLLGLGYAIIQRLLLLLPHGIAFLAMYSLVRYILLNSPDRPTRKVIMAISVTSGVIYTLNPWIAVQPRDIALRFDYALTPLVVLLFFSVFKKREGRFRNIILFSLTLSFIACFRYVLIILPALVLFLIIPAHRDGEESSLRRRLSAMVLILLCFSFLSLGKFLSPILYSLQWKQVPYAESFHEDMIGEASILEVLSTKVLSSPARRALDETYSDPSYQLFSIISVFSFLYLVLIRRRLTKNELLFPLLMVVTIPLAVLKQTPFKEFNLWLLTEAPLSNLYGRLMRHADWNSLPVLMAIAVMSGLTLCEILRRVPQKSCTICLFSLPLAVTVLCGISSWPLLTGDMNGYWRPSAIPEEFDRVNESFRKESDDFHVLWLPTYWENKASWAKNTGLYESTAPTCNFDIRSSSKPSYLMEHFYVFDYYNLLGSRPGFRPLDGYAGEHIADIYKDLNIRYAVIHTDVNWGEVSRSMGFNNVKIQQVIDSLKNNPVVKSVVDEDCLSIIEMAPHSQEFKATIPLSVLGGLPVHGAIADAEVSLKNASLVYLESTHFAWDDFQRLIQASPTLLIKGKTDATLSYIVLAMDKKKIHAPYKHTLKHDPLLFWSKGRVQTVVGDAGFQEALWALGLNDWSWDFDYGEGLVFTVAPDAELSFPAKIQQAGTYILLVRYFANAKGDAVSFGIGNKEVSLLTKNPRNYFEWKLLSYLNLSEGEHTITMKNIYGFNAVNLVGLIPVHQFEERKQEIEALLDSKSCVYLYEAETDFETENADIYKESLASNGWVLRLGENSWAKCQLEIIKDGDYRLQFKLKGSLQITIDNVDIKLHSDELRFVSSSIQHLLKGEHELNITPLEYPSYLDVVWIGPADKGEDINEWLTAKDNRADLTTSKKMSNSKMTLHIKTTEPFLLSVAEGYDPLVAAYSNGTKYNSFPVFGVINGFLINEQGDIDVDIKFLPQIWTQIGTWISLISALFLIAYAVYEWLQQMFKRKLIRR